MGCDNKGSVVLPLMRCLDVEVNLDRYMKTNFFKNLEAGLCSVLSEISETKITPELLRDSRKLEAVLERKRREKWERQAPERERKRVAQEKELEERVKRARARRKELEARLKEYQEKANEN